ncbi:RWD-domain-containing protein [Venturia nashicola]|nr:RWD-domain-containing protein [Venturia nashicola]
MGLEEQKEEREVLDSIFPEEITGSTHARTDISETEYRISIQLDITQDESDESELPVMLLRVEYPEDYPDTAPRLDIIPPPNAPKHKFFDVQEDKTVLLEALEPTIEENLGMAMIFTIVSTLKDEAELLVAERSKAAQAIIDFAKAKQEEEDNKKFHGTAVTRETFLEWRKNFNAEIAEEERKKKEEQEAEDKKKRGAKEEIKLTGRQLWERGMAGKLEDDDGEEEGMEEMMDKTKIEAGG